MELPFCFGSLAAALLLPAVCSVDAAEFSIAAGDVAALKASITSAKANNQDDVINLAPGTYTLARVDNTLAGGSPNGLPVIRADGAQVRSVTLNGNGATVARSAVQGTAAFRILQIAPSAHRCRTCRANSKIRSSSYLMETALS